MSKRKWSPSRQARLDREEAARKRSVGVEDPDRDTEARVQVRCPYYAQDVALEIIIAKNAPFWQHDLAKELQDRLGLEKATAQGYVSGALLAFRAAGWVRRIDGTESGVFHHQLWERIDE